MPSAAAVEAYAAAQKKVSKTDLVEGKYTFQQLLDTAEKVVAKKTGDSRILDIEAENRIPKFQYTEIDLGRVLGRGGFCVVNEVTKITLEYAANGDDRNTHPVSQLQKFDDEYQIHNIVQDRAFMEAHCLRGKGKDCRYAIKQLQDSTLTNAQTFINGVVDLAVEARFLSVIRHPNIIKMRAMATTSPYSRESPFFVILDRLYDIMGQRIVKWKKQKPGGIQKLLDRKGKKEMAFLVERLAVAYDLARALSYLHELNIIYRDLKPDNIGFDVRGDVKIFDFGLAKEIDPSKADGDGTFLLTGDTGSPRYMAPEVALEKPYNELVDVYSFTILLWQMLQLETPFAGFTMAMFSKNVIQQGARPKIDPKWPPEICDILQRGWGESTGRPSMSDVVITLRDYVNSHSEEYNETGSDLVDASRKSDISARQGRNSGKSFVSAHELQTERRLDL